MSNETPVERFTASRHILENRELVDDYVECVLASDYDKLKAERDAARAARAESNRTRLSAWQAPRGLAARRACEASRMQTDAQEARSGDELRTSCAGGACGSQG